LTNLDQEVLKRSAKATYRLDKPDGVTIKSIQAVLKKGDQVVKTLIKNIKETSLISVDDQGLETDSSLLSETPSDVKPYYLKVTTHDNKVTKLAVDKIEEVTVDGATLYKVTAKAPDLVQRTGDNQFNENYVHYIAKPTNL